jgi:hypothetical protein
VLAGTLILGFATPAAGETEWLPPGTLHPRNLADPLESRLGLSYAPEPDHLDAALGAPLPIVSFPLSGRTFLAVLEAGLFIRLGRDGSFFPLRTVDGLFGAGLETRRGRFAGRLRLMHHSAHKADGDSTVAYRDFTFSREFWELEVSLIWDRASIYFRAGSAWHSVPEDKGPAAALGGAWKGKGASSRPFAAVHLEADRGREWRVSKSVLIGWEAGSRRFFRVGLKLFDGHSPRGQYWETTESHLGIDLQFTP